MSKKLKDLIDLELINSIMSDLNGIALKIKYLKKDVKQLKKLKGIK